MKYPTTKVVGFIWRSMKPYRGRFFLASLLRLSSDVVFLYAPYALGKIISLLSVKRFHEVWFYLGAWMAVVLYRSFIVPYAKYLTSIVGYKTCLDLDVVAIRHLASLDISWHERENSGRKVKRIQKALDGIDRIFRLWINNYIEITVNFVGMLTIILFFSVPIGIALGCFMLVFTFVALRFTRAVAVASDAVNKGEEDVDGLTFEIVNNIRSVKVLLLAESMVVRVREKLRNLFGVADTFFRKTAANSFFTHVAPNLFRFTAYTFIIIGIVQGRYEIGFLVTFWAYFNNIWESLRELAETTQDFAVAKQAVGRLMDTLDVPIAIDDDEGKIGFADDWKAMRLIDVSFAYGNNDVLKHLSFEVKRGEKIGIVGPSGAGKSTIFKLLLKEHESFSGDIQFDDTSIVEMKKSDYLKRVAVVLQDTEVFNFSLKDNITISDPDAKDTDARLAEALAVAHVDEFVGKLPDGIDTLIGEKGVKLSGGERQRLGIARAIYRKPEILFLDEATSHLDLESEERIRDSLHRFFKSVTAIVIAHRLTTIREMDRILVIEDGRIVESGSFDMLMKKKARFAELWQKQRL